jgi:hypothetical protein
MRLKNFTDISSDEIRNLIRAVRPSGISNFDVRVSNGQRFRGRAYSSSGYHDRACPFIVCAIPKVWKPRVIDHGPGKGYLPIAIGSRMEALVVLLAHELRHIWQGATSGKRKGMVWGARGRFSERDADAYALQMLRRYRRGELVQCGDSQP